MRVRCCVRAHSAGVKPSVHFAIKGRKLIVATAGNQIRFSDIAITSSGGVQVYIVIAMKPRYKGEPGGACSKGNTSSPDALAAS